jgi:hypothetical protein
VWDQRFTGEDVIPKSSDKGKGKGKSLNANMPKFWVARQRLALCRRLARVLRREGAFKP